MYAHIRKRHGNEVQNDAKMNNEESEEKENHPAEKVFKKSTTITLTFHDNQKTMMK